MTMRRSSFHPSSRSVRPFRRLPQAGFTIAEVALALVIFTLMVVLYAAVFPMTVRGAQYSGNYTQAAMLAQHKMDQLRTAGYARLFDGSDSTALAKMSSLAIVDAPQPSGYPLLVSHGTTYSFTTADALVSDGVTQGYFPAGSQGVVTISDYAALHPSSGIAANMLAYVTVTLTWTSATASSRSYSTSALIANIKP